MSTPFAGSVQVIGSTGPVSGALIDTFVSGTLTPQAAYTTASLSTPHSNPIVCDSLGRAAVWLNPALTYRIRYRNADGTVISGADFDEVESPSVAEPEPPAATDVDALDVTFTPAGPGAAESNVQAKLREWVSVKDHGAAGDNAANDGPDVRSVLQSFGLLGGLVRVPHDIYRIDASVGSGLTISDPVSLVGEGGVYTAINPAGAASTDNTISVIPGAVDHTLQKIEGLSLHNPYTGQRVGNHGIYLDTQTASRNLSKFTIRDVLVGQGNNASGYGIYHLNNGTNNINGGLFGSLFQNNNIKGGVKFEGSGDSLSVLHNIITGSGIGVNASLVFGASLLEVQANNITNDGGAIRIDAGSRPRIIGNNIENLAPGAAAQNDSAVVNITGANGVIYGGVIKENLISGFGTSGATTLLRMRNCRGTLVEDNVMLSGAAGLTVGVDIGTDCQSVRIGANSFNAGITTRVLDNGVGTMGVLKTATLQNSWVAFAVGTAPLKFIKSGDGLVHLYGCIKSGTTTNDTIIATLPVGFRPSEVIRAPVMVVNAGTPQIAEVSVESDGNVRINYVLSSNQLNINLTFPADELAHAASLE